MKPSQFHKMASEPKRQRVHDDDADEGDGPPSSPNRANASNGQVDEQDNQLGDFPQGDSSVYDDDGSSRTKQTKSVWRISDFSRLKASAWNGYAKQVYSAFKVETYIVNPNYLLCVSKDVVPLCLTPTINELLRLIPSANEYQFPPW